MSAPNQITALLHAAADGDEGALQEVTERVYGDLERLAGSKLRREYGNELAGATLEPAALVNETLFKVLQHSPEFANRRHFFAFANKVMSRVLLDHERRKRAAKRGGDAVRVTLSGLGRPDAEIRALELVDLLQRLEEVDARKAEVVRLRIFWGLANAEIAETLDVSVPTIERDWRFAHRWIGARLSPTSD